MSRDYRYLEEAGITLAIDVNKGRAKIALAACNFEDNFSLKAGKNVVNVLLDGDNATLRAFGLNRNVVSFPYNKDKPRQHILKRVINYLADELGERVFFRQLHSMFMNGIVTQGIAAQVAQRTKDETIYYQFTKLVELFEDEDLELLQALETEADLYSHFYSWQGSVDTLMTKLRQFASEVYSGEIKLIDEPAASKDKVAPRRPNPDKSISVSSKSIVKDSAEEKEVKVDEPPNRSVAAKPVKSSS